MMKSQSNPDGVAMDKETKKKFKRTLQQKILRSARDRQRYHEKNPNAKYRPGSKYQRVPAMAAMAAVSWMEPEQINAFLALETDRQQEKKRAELERSLIRQQNLFLKNSKHLFHQQEQASKHMDHEHEYRLGDELAVSVSNAASNGSTVNLKPSPHARGMVSTISCVVLLLGFDVATFFLPPFLHATRPVLPLGQPNVMMANPVVQNVLAKTCLLLLLLFAVPSALAMMCRRLLLLEQPKVNSIFVE